MASCFRVTFSRDGHKNRKNRKFVDGFVSQSGRDAKLFDERGGIVVVARLPADLVLADGDEVMDQGFGQNMIVYVDTPCAPSDIGGGETSSTHLSQCVSAHPAAAAGCSQLPAATAATAAAAAAGVPRLGGMRASGGGILRKPGGKPAFKAPRLAAAPALAAHPNAVHPVIQTAYQPAAHHTQPGHQNTFTVPCRGPGQQTAGRQPVPLAAAGEQPGSGGCWSVVASLCLPAVQDYFLLCCPYITRGQEPSSCRSISLYALAVYHTPRASQNPHRTFNTPHALVQTTSCCAC